MTNFCGVHRTPRAGIDPIESANAALAVIRQAMRHPLVDETVALLLDADLRGRTIVVVDGTKEPECVLDVVERLAENIAASGRTGALVIASVRPGSRPVSGDDELWLEATDLAETAGVELLEWFVIADDAGSPTVWCPRDLLGEPPRWPLR